MRGQFIGDQSIAGTCTHIWHADQGTLLVGHWRDSQRQPLAYLQDSGELRFLDLPLLSQLDWLNHVVLPLPEKAELSDSSAGFMLCSPVSKAILRVSGDGSQIEWIYYNPERYLLHYDSMGFHKGRLHVLGEDLSESCRDRKSKVFCWDSRARAWSVIATGIEPGTGKLIDIYDDLYVVSTDRVYICPTQDGEKAEPLLEFDRGQYVSGAQPTTNGNKIVLAGQFAEKSHLAFWSQWNGLEPIDLEICDGNGKASCTCALRFVDDLSLVGGNGYFLQGDIREQGGTVLREGVIITDALPVCEQVSAFSDYRGSLYAACVMNSPPDSSDRSPYSQSRIYRVDRIDL